MGKILLSNGSILEVDEQVIARGETAIVEHLNAILDKDPVDFINESDYCFDVENRSLEVIDIQKAKEIHESRILEIKRLEGDVEKWLSRL